MSAAIAYSGFIYVLAALLLAIGILAFVKRDASRLNRILHAEQPGAA